MTCSGITAAGKQDKDMDTEQKKRKQICVMTGASGGIGSALLEILAERYDKIYRIGKTFHPGARAGKCEMTDVLCDLTDMSDIEKAIGSVEESEVDILVNCAGTAYYGVSDSIGSRFIKEMVDVNVTAPMVLTSALLPRIKKAKGTVVFVSSILARKEASTHAAVYGASKKALSFYAASLFEEMRKHDVRVMTVCPDVTDTGLYRNADFGVGGEPDNTLDPADVAEALRFALDQRPGMCVTEIVLRPQKNAIKKKQRTDRK